MTRIKNYLFGLFCLAFKEQIEDLNSDEKQRFFNAGFSAGIDYKRGDSGHKEELELAKLEGYKLGQDNALRQMASNCDTDWSQWTSIN